MSRSIPAFVQPCTWAPDADSSLPPQCLKITEKVSFNILRYILSGQKFIKNAKKKFGEFFEKPEACGQTVLPDRSLLIGQKLMENVKIEKF